MAWQQLKIFSVGFLFILLALSGPVWGQWPRTHQDDVIELTLRHQSGIILDSVLSQAIDHHLTIARNVLDTLEGIHTFPSYTHKQLTAMPSGTWADTSWLQNKVLTGDAYLDSLGSVYGLVQLGEVSQLGFVDLQFDAIMVMNRLAEIYAASPLINWAESSGYGGDGDDIQLVRLDSVWNFIFSKGWGDCWAGCIDHHYWYIEVMGEVGNLVLDTERSFTEPILYHWNVPPRYAVAMFAGADTLISAITKAPAWWVRRHAIESSWRLAVKSYPWVGEDSGSHWYTLKGQLLNALSELQIAYTMALDDPNPAVVSSAEQGLDTLSSSGLLRSEVISAHPSKYQFDTSYPNPFNASTSFRFELPEAIQISLVVYDLMGREVVRLVDKRLDAGSHLIIWDATNQTGRIVPTGIYIARLMTPEYTKSIKMVLLK